MQVGASQLDASTVHGALLLSWSGIPLLYHHTDTMTKLTRPTAPWLQAAYEPLPSLMNDSSYLQTASTIKRQPSISEFRLSLSVNHQ